MIEIRQHLLRAAARLKTAGIEQPLREAESLLAYALGRDVSWILAHPEAGLTPARRRMFRAMTDRRAKHLPFAYVVGRKAFYGREFRVTEDVLIPRPETEILIEAALAVLKDRDDRGPLNVMDIGTGSGAIGLTLATDGSAAHALLTDVSAKALAVARRNGRMLKIAARYARLDVLKPSPRPRLRPGFLILAANLPYLPERRMRTVAPEVRREPRIALVSGPDGLRHYRALAVRLREWQLVPDLLLLEAEPEQMNRLETLYARILPEHRFRRAHDLHGDERVLIATKNPA